MSNSGKPSGINLSRRGFLQTVGVTTTGLSLVAGAGNTAPRIPAPAGKSNTKALVRGAFLYPPTRVLHEAGYYSWPGSSFDAEGRQVQYVKRLRQMEQDYGIQLSMNEKPLDEEASVNAFIADTKQNPPDGLLLIPFKKSHWTHVTRIVEECGVPAVVLATLGVLLSDHIRLLHDKPGVYMISASDDLDAVGWGLCMIRAARWIRDSRILNIDGEERKQSNVPFLNTEILTVPHQQFYEVFAQMRTTDEVKKLADVYRNNAREIVQPSDEDILEAARAYFALKQLIQEENADAMMMQCLAGLRRPHKHVPPCMGFMTLRDQGIPAGCQSDLNATLSLMLTQYLFGKPGFQQNASMNTEKNLYFGAHCTSPSKMQGVDGPAEPYVLMSHAEAGWGCVPRVLFKEGQPVTLCQYVSGEAPQMILYTGEVVRCPAIPPTGGCRTNIEMTINEVDDVCDVKGMHQAIIYGDYGEEMRTFCRMYGIEIIT